MPDDQISRDLANLMEENLTTSNSPLRTEAPGPEYITRVDSARRRKRSRPALVAVVAATVAIAGLGVVAAVGSSEQPASEVTVAAPPSQTGADRAQPTPEEIEAANRRLDEQIASGWLPYSGASAIEGKSSAPEGSWWPAGAIPSGDDGRIPIFDEPDGEVIGYYFSNLGFIALDDLDGFDARAERIKTYGCDTLESECAEQLSSVDPNGGGAKASR